MKSQDTRAPFLRPFAWGTFFSQRQKNKTKQKNSSEIRDPNRVIYGFSFFLTSSIIYRIYLPPSSPYTIMASSLQRASHSHWHSSSLPCVPRTACVSASKKKKPKKKGKQKQQTRARSGPCRRRATAKTKPPVLPSSNKNWCCEPCALSYPHSFQISPTHRHTHTE